MKTKKNELVRDKAGHLCFKYKQRYMLPVNEKEEGGSVSVILISIDAGQQVHKVFHAVRKYLRNMKVDVVQYCHEAEIKEVLCCGEYPEVK